MSKVIYKYNINDNKCIVEMPFRAQLLTVNFDTAENLCVWAIHDTEDPKGDFVEYEFLILGTGELTDEPLNVLNDFNKDGFSYYTTLVSRAFVWHIFMRMRYWDEKDE